MSKSYILLRMYDKFNEIGQIKINECCGEFDISVSTFRRYIAFLRVYFFENYNFEIFYDPATESYKLEK